MSTAKKLERRFVTGIEVRDTGGADGRIGTLTGYAAVFNSLSEDLGGFREMIRPGAFRESLSRGDDIRALVGHDSTMIIGRRSAKTLDIVEDERGLKVEIAVPDTTAGRDLLVSVRRRDLNTMSFGFSTVKDEWARTNKDGDVVYRRELIQVDLFEVSAVAFAAYSETSIEARSIVLGTQGLVEAQRAHEAQLATDAQRGQGTDARARRERITRAHEQRMKLWA
jgi:uncharacterized protein